MNHKKSGRVGLGAVWLSLGLFLLPAFAQEDVVIVLGSFSDRHGAETFIGTLTDAQDVELTVTPAVQSGRTLYRVHSIPDTDIERVRERLAVFRTGPVKDAWLWRMEAPETPAAVPNIDSAVEPAQVARIEPAKAVDAVEALSVLDETTKVLMVSRHDDPQIRLDGRLDEPVWGRVQGYDNMIVIEPDVLEKPIYRTRTKLFYTDNGLYVGMEAEQPADSLLPRLSSRDQEINRDGTYFYLDTSGEGLYGLFFGGTLGGTLIDGTLLPERQMSTLWDGPWDGEAAETSYGYSTEMFLPWSMMSMPEISGRRKMGFSVTRQVAYLDAKWGWPALPTSQPR
ncbi:MAG: hypothetical protein HUJ31_07255, partial [Pseudomonadales bacterium]|nr:hypothetical protein [Pseudomonadales bacterium]